MANKSLTDLTARTATADSDLLHINSGGTDYKETKENFADDLAQRASFNNTSDIKTQAGALSRSNKLYYGICNSYGHQTETGSPINANFYVTVHVNSSNSMCVELIVIGSSGRRFQAFQNAGTWTAWEELPARSEITSLNNSLTKSSSSYTVSSNVSVIRLVCYKVAGIFVCSGVVTLSSGFTTGASLLKLSDIRPVETIDFTPYVAGGSPPWYLDTYGWMHCNGSTPTGTYFFNFCGSLA